MPTITEVELAGVATEEIPTVVISQIGVAKPRVTTTTTPAAVAAVAAVAAAAQVETLADNLSDLKHKKKKTM
jgi:hypothetical protein